MAFLAVGILLLTTYGLSIVPALLVTISMLHMRHHWPVTHQPVLRALSFQGMAMLGGLGVLALSPSCAAGGLLALAIMNLLATTLGRTPRA